ncbi:MAG: type II toxin-antitoxin system Phd/YefM family antitoxin [Nitrococcus sp.]|nr:type II toxin-antitoxin system Phd/YefM family antitoxin [Nitrococcus sp.]
MHTVTMLDLRRNPKSVINRVLQGEALTLTYRGRAVMRLSPIKQAQPPADDLFYRLCDFAEEAEPLPEHNRDRTIDRIIYGA